MSAELDKYIAAVKAYNDSNRVWVSENLKSYRDIVQELATKDVASEGYDEFRAQVRAIGKAAADKGKETVNLLLAVKDAENDLGFFEKRTEPVTSTVSSLNALIRATTKVFVEAQEFGQEVITRKDNERKALDQKPKTENPGTNTATAATAVVVNDTTPPPPIKLESVTSDHAIPSTIPGTSVPIPINSKTAANIINNPNETLTRAIDNPIPPTNPGTVVGRTAIRVSGGAQRVVSVPETTNSEDRGTLRDSIVNNAKKRYESEELPENPLLNYSSYTYGFVLAALAPEEYNSLVRKTADFSISGYKPKNVIIASAGRNSAQLPRDPRFTKDFYITDLKMNTVVGMNARSRSSNVTDLSFKIVEPLGVSFFDRLYEMSSQLGFKNYLEISYLLIIEFFGYNDDGTPDQSTDLKSHTKLLPIKIAKVKMSVTASGAEYDVQAVPYNHAAFLTTAHGSTPANVQISSNTVGDFFASAGADAIQALADRASADQREVDEQLEAINSLPEASTEDRRKAINELQNTFSNKYYNAKSYAQVLNSFELKMKLERRIESTNIYQFSIDEEIAQSAIIEFNKIPANRIAFSRRAEADLYGNQATEVEYNGLFAINAGTSVIDVINMVMKNSSYIRDQIKGYNGANQNQDPETIANKINKPLKWYKIIPSVEILEYDSKRNIYTKKITFHIRKYYVYNTKSALVEKSLPKNYMKEYKYIFTGDNRDIIDLQIDFDVLYFVTATLDRTKWNVLNSGAQSPNDGLNTSSAVKSGTIADLKTNIVSSNASAIAGDGSAETARGIAASDLYNTVLSKGQGDMINVNLKIIGDPRYIKQDDVFFNPSSDLDDERTVKNSLTDSTLINRNQNIVLFDREERFVKVTFNTPVDTADNGLLELDDQFKTSRFSGLYRVLKIENTFSKGKFEQVLNLVRIFEQEDVDAALNQSDAETQRLLRYSKPGGDNISSVADAREGANAQPEIPAPTAGSLPIPKPAIGSVQLPTGQRVPTPLTSIPTSLPSTLPSTVRLDSDPNMNPNETPPTPGVKDQDRLEALRIQNQSGDPDAITAEQVASNRRVNERLTAALGIPPGAGTPSQEDSGSSVTGG